MNTNIQANPTVTSGLAGPRRTSTMAKSPHQASKQPPPHPCVRPRFIRPSNIMVIIEPPASNTLAKQPSPTAYSGCSCAARARVRGSIRYIAQQLAPDAFLRETTSSHRYRRQTQGKACSLTTLDKRAETNERKKNATTPPPRDTHALDEQQAAPRRAAPGVRERRRPEATTTSIPGRTIVLHRDARLPDERGRLRGRAHVVERRWVER